MSKVCIANIQPGDVVVFRIITAPPHSTPHEFAVGCIDILGLIHDTTTHRWVYPHEVLSIRKKSK